MDTFTARERHGLATLLGWSGPVLHYPVESGVTLITVVMATCNIAVLNGSVGQVRPSSVEMQVVGLKL